MRRLLFLLSVCGPLGLFAQFAINPQLGVTFQDLTDQPEGSESKAAVGFMLGGDLRIGGRFHFQPGAFFVRSSTVVKSAVSDTAVIEDNLVRSSLKLKALVGYKLIDDESFKLRFNIGPTYDVLLSVDNKDDKIEWNRDDFNSGSFNMDAGLGLDLAIFTVEGGVSYGLTNAFKEQDGFSSDAKYFTVYATLGLVFGGGE